MAYPTVKAGTTNVDAGSDSPKLARADIKQNIDNVNALIDHFDGTGPIKIQDNEIETTRSNDNLFIRASGTGSIILDDTALVGGELTSNPTGVGTNAIGGRLNYENLTDVPGTREYALGRTGMWKTNGADSSSSLARYRMQDTLSVDLNDSALSSTSTAAGAQIQHLLELRDTSTGTSTLGNASANAAGVYFPDGGTASTINVSDAYAYRAFGLSTPGSGATVNVTDAYAFYYGGFSTSGSGTTNITNDYFLYTTDDDALSRVGTLERYQEKVTALSSATTIAVDCANGSVFTVTLSHNANFVLSNFATGQSVSIIITQDTDSTANTGTFYSADSTAVKFSEGLVDLAQQNGGIDIVHIFNDGTNLLGTVSPNYRAI